MLRCVAVKVRIFYLEGVGTRAVESFTIILGHIPIIKNPFYFRDKT